MGSLPRPGLGGLFHALDFECRPAGSPGSPRHSADGRDDGRGRKVGSGRAERFVFLRPDAVSGMRAAGGSRPRRQKSNWPVGRVGGKRSRGFRGSKGPRPCHMMDPSERHFHGRNADFGPRARHACPTACRKEKIRNAHMSGVESTFCLSTARVRAGGQGCPGWNPPGPRWDRVRRWDATIEPASRVAGDRGGECR